MKTELKQKVLPFNLNNCVYDYSLESQNQLENQSNDVYKSVEQNDLDLAEQMAFLVEKVKNRVNQLTWENYWIGLFDFHSMDIEKLSESDERLWRRNTFGIK